MKPKEKQLYEQLAETLVTPERFGAVALAPTVQMHLFPELARVYEFPAPSGDSAA